MSLNLKEMKIIETAIKENKMVGRTERGFIVNEDDSRACSFVKTYSNDTIITVYERLGGDNGTFKTKKQSEPKRKRAQRKEVIIKHEHVHHEDSCCCMPGFRLATVSNRNM